MLTDAPSCPRRCGKIISFPFNARHHLLQPFFGRAHWNLGWGLIVSDGVGSVRDILYLSGLAIPPHPWDRDHPPSSTITPIFKPQEHSNLLEAASVCTASRARSLCRRMQSSNVGGSERGHLPPRSFQICSHASCAMGLAVYTLEREEFAVDLHCGGSNTGYERDTLVCSFFRNQCPGRRPLSLVTSAVDTLNT